MEIIGGTEMNFTNLKLLNTCALNTNVYSI
jgi:hypothetical protein